jgi:hypothetical protein
MRPAPGRFFETDDPVRAKNVLFSFGTALYFSFYIRVINGWHLICVLFWAFYLAESVAPSIFSIPIALQQPVEYFPLSLFWIQASLLEGLKSAIIATNPDFVGQSSAKAI